MLLNEFPTEEFLEVFKKKFTSFCNKAPVIISFKVTPTSCFVQEMGTKEIKKFDFDFNKPVEVNIFEIKQWLLDKKYPRMIQLIEREEDLSPEEAEELISQGVPTERVFFGKKKTTEATEWRIEKAIIKRDEVFVRNLSTDKYYRYKLHMPSTIFLKRMREGKYNPFEAWVEFQEKAEFLNEILPLKEDNSQDTSQEYDLNKIIPKVKSFKVKKATK